MKKLENILRGVIIILLTLVMITNITFLVIIDSTYEAIRDIELLLQALSQ